MRHSPSVPDKDQHNLSRVHSPDAPDKDLLYLSRVHTAELFRVKLTRLKEGSDEVVGHVQVETIMA
jgi:hypothetical protein